MEVLPSELELLTLAYACDIDGVCVFFLECCWAGDSHRAKAVASLFDLAAAVGGFCRLSPDQLRARMPELRAVWLDGYYEPTVAAPLVGGLVALALACKNGHPGLAQWITDYFGFDGSRAPVVHFSVLLDAACIGGRLDVARWLADRFGETMCAVHASTAFGLACRSGCLPLVEWLAGWLVGRIGMPSSVLRAASVDDLPNVCGRGHATTARWLIEHFELSGAEVRHSRHEGGAAWAVAQRLPGRDLADWMSARFGF